VLSGTNCHPDKRLASFIRDVKSSLIGVYHDACNFRRKDLVGSHLPVFIEKALLPMGSVAFGYAMWTNPMKFDLIQRISFGIAVVAFMFFLSHSLHLRNEAIRLGSGKPLPSAPAVDVVNSPHQMSRDTGNQPNVQQRSSGANSPNVSAGDNAKIEINGKEE
jgi:hypothetical protein